MLLDFVNPDIILMYCHNYKHTDLYDMVSWRTTDMV